MPLDAKSPKVVAEMGKHLSAVGSGNKTQITLVACISAASIPPMVIWDRKQLSPELSQGEIPGTTYGLSSNGWMDQELFGVCPDTVRLAAKEKVILFTLPPNTTHHSPLPAAG